jgi:hypothetical protein
MQKPLRASGNLYGASIDGLRGDVFDLLVKFSNREVPEPKDRMYALVGMQRLMAEDMTYQVFTVPDYDPSTEEAYIKFASNLNCSDARLRTFGVHFATRSMELPSRVPDWSMQVSFDFHYYRFLTYQAGSFHLSSAKWSPVYKAAKDVLVTSGVMLDKVRRVLSYWVMPLDDPEHQLTRLIQLIYWWQALQEEEKILGHNGSSYVGRGTLPMAFEQTVFAARKWTAYGFTPTTPGDLEEVRLSLKWAAQPMESPKPSLQVLLAVFASQ